MIARTRELSAAERLDWLRLTRSESVGPITFRQLLQHHGSAAAALAALPELARRGGRSGGLRLAPRADAEREMELLERIGARLVALGEPLYPAALAEIEDAPPLLAVLGDPTLLMKPIVGVVGARNASTNGMRFARALARGLGEAGFVVASGFARGIDAAAHEGALETGTIATMAGGIDIVYPREHAILYERVAEAGVAISECAPGTEPTARHFPRRNRLIAGLSLGIVVVEAALRSGSLITARLAGEQGRQVLAVPGWPQDPRSQGCNKLIREGAILVESAEQVVEAVASQIRRPLREPAERSFGTAAPPLPAGEADAARDLVLGRLSPHPTAVDELLRDCQLSAPVVLTVLLELELAGRIERQPGNRVALLTRPHSEANG